MMSDQLFLEKFFVTFQLSFFLVAGQQILLPLFKVFKVMNRAFSADGRQQLSSKQLSESKVLGIVSLKGFLNADLHAPK